GILLRGGEATGMEHRVRSRLVRHRRVTTGPVALTLALALGLPGLLGRGVPVVAAQGVPQGVPAPQVPAAPGGAPLDAGLAREVDLVNAERQKAGLALLVVEPHLSQVAQRYTELMASSGCFAHTCGPLPELPQRVEAAGYTSWSRLGENI